MRINNIRMILFIKSALEIHRLCNLKVNTPFSLKISKFLITSCLVFVFQFSFAGEGMWIPLLLKALNEAEAL